jgi:hypothetical protein
MFQHMVTTRFQSDSNLYTIHYGVPGYRSPLCKYPYLHRSSSIRTPQSMYLTSSHRNEAFHGSTENHSGHLWK